MFKIYDGREYFYQWDLDRKLIVEDAAITQVHFCNRTGDCSLVCETFVEDGLTLVNVPNILLQTDWKIHVYAYDGKHTKHDESYEVKSRTKPSDYVYTETEVLNYEALEERIAALEENGGSSSIVVDQTFNPESENAQSGVAIAGVMVQIAEGFNEVVDVLNDKADKSEVEYLTNRVDNEIQPSIDSLWWDKADKPIIERWEDTTYIFEFSNTHNREKRLAETTSMSFTFGNGEYELDYTSGLSFDSGAAPTAINYTGSGILNWVGTDCTKDGEYSIFQPSANTHYDIVFYYNGKQFIGLVNGFAPATGNVVS